MGIGQWFNHDFSPVIVDIGLSVHAHFDHDGLHRLHANMLMDSIVGEFSLGDVRIHGIAEKHVSDFSHCIYNFTEATMERGVDPRPPDNPRSWDNTLFVIETAGLRILHWGDNRPDPPEEVWRAIGEIDIELLPIDDSQHILSYEHVDDVLKRTRAKVCIPGHYRACHRVTYSLRIRQWHSARRQTGAHRSRIRRLGQSLRWLSPARATGSVSSGRAGRRVFRSAGMGPAHRRNASGSPNADGRRLLGPDTVGADCSDRELGVIAPLLDQVERDPVCRRQSRGERYQAAGRGRLVSREDAVEEAPCPPRSSSRVSSRSPARLSTSFRTDRPLRVEHL